MRAFWKSTSLATAALLVIPGAARAGSRASGVELEYDDRSAPVGCPTGAELRTAIAERLGYDPFVEPQGKRELVVQVQMRRTSAGTQADIAWRNAAGAIEGERQLVSDNDECEEVASGVVFAVAVQLEMRAENSPPAAPEPPKPAPSKALPEQPPPSPPRVVLVGLGGFLEHGLQPAEAPGLRAFGAWRASHWSLGVDAYGTLTTEWRSALGNGFSARTWGVGLFPCLRASPWDVCLLGEVGQLSVTGQGVDRVRSPSSVFVGVGLRAQVTWPELGRLATLLHVDAWAPLTPRDILLNDENVWGTAPVVLQAGLDIAAIFR